MAKKKYFTDESLQTLVDETKGYVDENIADLQNATISLKNGTNIPANSDLNTYTTIGNYKCTVKATVETFLNCPTTQSFKLVVENTALFDGGGYRTQTITDLDGDVYTRYTWDNGVNWGKWKHKLDDSMIITVKNGGTYNSTLADVEDGRVIVKKTDGSGKAFLGSVNCVPIANGGTGANNASDARTNLGITPSNIGALSTSSGGDVNGFTRFVGGYGRGLTASSSGALVIDSPADGVVFKASANATGILKVLLPQDFNGAMIKFDVEICGYNRQAIATYSFGGQIYKNSSTGACQWANRSYDINGSSGNGTLNLDINFGRHNEKAAVSIGMSDTVWGYHVATIKNIVVYYSKYSTDLWSSGWQILIDSNPLSEIYNTYTNPLERKLSSLGATSVTIKRWEETD